jgi:hypothetical protein
MSHDGEMFMRKLASVQKIISVSEIINPKTGLPADSIEAVGVLGWTCVARKGTYKVGDLVIYFEIDSIIPEALLKSQGLWDEAKGKGMLGRSNGDVLRTKKLLGVVSQGLVANIRSLGVVDANLKEDDDLTDILSIKKYEQYVEEEFEPGTKRKQGFKSKMIRKFKPQIIWLSQYIPWFKQFIGAGGAFPDYVQKTDQTRIQNLTRNWEELREDHYEITEKMEGTSSTYFYNRGDYGMCSRNLRKPNNDTTHFGQVEKKYNIFKKLIEYKKNIALQGEICGPGIQGNYYALPEFTWFVFDVYLIDEHRKALPGERQCILTDLGLEINQAPINTGGDISDLTIQQVLDLAVRKSVINPKVDAEGLVFKSTTKNQSFKAINNNYLLKEK